MSVKFHIPGIYSHFFLNINFINLVHNHPEYFYDGVEISSVYGTIPPAIWNGGRSIRGRVDDEAVPKIINAYNSRNTMVRFTFTNPMLEERHLSDRFCNYMCKTAEEYGNEIIIFSPMLEEYIRKTYPKYTYTSSTCKQIEDADELKEELEKDYRLVVLDYNWNNQFDFLETLPHKEKCEFLLNAICVSHCKFRGEHYRYLGKQQIYINEVLPIVSNNLAHISGEGEEDFKCPYNTSLRNGTNQKTYISPEALYGKYVPMGFDNFKIEGRTYDHFDMLLEYIKYMVKPEYGDTVIEHMVPLIGDL